MPQPSKYPTAASKKLSMGNAITRCKTETLTHGDTIAYQCREIGSTGGTTSSSRPGDLTRVSQKVEDELENQKMSKETSRKTSLAPTCPSLKSEIRSTLVGAALSFATSSGSTT